MIWWCYAPCFIFDIIRRCLHFLIQILPLENISCLVYLSKILEIELVILILIQIYPSLMADKIFFGWLAYNWDRFCWSLEHRLEVWEALRSFTCGIGLRYMVRKLIWCLLRQLFLELLTWRSAYLLISKSLNERWLILSPEVAGRKVTKPTHLPKIDFSTSLHLISFELIPFHDTHELRIILTFWMVRYREQSWVVRIIGVQQRALTNVHWVVCVVCKIVFVQKRGKSCSILVFWRTFLQRWGSQRAHSFSLLDTILLTFDGWLKYVPLLWREALGVFKKILLELDPLGLSHMHRSFHNWLKILPELICRLLGDFIIRVDHHSRTRDWSHLVIIRLLHHRWSIGWWLERLLHVSC